MTYHVNPQSGDDQYPGTGRDRPWGSFQPLHSRELQPGDRLEVSPGEFHASLVVTGQGTATAPIVIHFAPGRYDLFPDGAERRQYHISNCNDDAEAEKAIGILIEHARHVQLTGAGARFVYRGKMIELCIDHSENVTVTGLQFDYHRPTVSEFTVVAATTDSADLEIHKDSAYRIENGRLIWEGEGWRHETGLAQELDLQAGYVWRRRDPLVGVTLEELGAHRVRAQGKHDLVAGRVIQIRETFRDCVGVFLNRSRDVVFQNVDFRFLHGMGVLCQFTENITLDTVAIAPDPQSGRTSAAWADCFHASGCRGKITVKNCLFAGAHDDAINIHGTYLQVADVVASHRIKVRFMHRQTYGFLAFTPGDEIEFVRVNTLATYASNRVTAVELLNPKELLLTLEQPVPSDRQADDVVENVTWTPAVEIRGCTVRHIPTRGYLLSTRRKVVVEDNTFDRTRMSAILVACEGTEWFESGVARDMTIAGNRFINCGKSAICIDSRTREPNPAVHQNIAITGNTFTLAGGLAVQAKSTTGLVIAGNTFRCDEPSEELSILDCADVRVDNNRRVELPG